MSELLEKSDLQKLLKIGLSKLDELIAEGRLPQPIKLGDRTVRWQAEVIEEWVRGGCQPPVQEATP